MTETIINIAEVRKDLAFATTLPDISIVQAEVEYLVDDAADRLNFAIIEANEALLSVRALNARRIIEKSTDL